MKRKTVTLPSLILLLSLALSACMGLLPLEDEPITGEFGPNDSLTEHQTRTFEALWKHLQDNYIYYDTANVDWASLHDEVAGRIEAGLTQEEFVDVLNELEADLPVGSLRHQSRAERIEGDTLDTSTYEGIGAFVGFNEEPVPHIVLLSIVEGSPAEDAGLKAHDSILEIDGSPVLLEEGITAVERVRGPAGSSVTLSIQSPGKAERSVEVKRGKLSSTGRLETSMITDTNYGYMLFPPLGYAALAEEVTSGLQTFTTNRKLEGLVLDLRIAGSSRGWPLEALFTMFHDGVIGQFYDRNNRQSVQVTGQDVFSSQTVPLVILVGKNTSGSPEILAASLQTYERAMVIGEQTPGLVETATSFYLPDGSEAFIETTSFLLPNGGEVGINGVSPDLPVEAGWDEVLPNNDPVLDRAIEYLGEQQ